MYEVRLPNACYHILVSISFIFFFCTVSKLSLLLTDSDVEAGLSDACHSDSSSETEGSDMEPNAWRYLL